MPDGGIVEFLAVVGTAAGASAASAAVVGGLIVAGTAMSIVGAVTGNKTLSMWGGIISLAGGIGGLASGSWASAAQGISAESSAYTATEMAASQEALAQTPTAVGAADATAVNGANLASDQVANAATGQAAGEAAGQAAATAPPPGLVNTPPAEAALPAATPSAAPDVSGVDLAADQATKTAAAGAPTLPTTPVDASTAGNFGTANTPYSYPGGQYQGVGTSPATGAGADATITQASNNFWDTVKTAGGKVMDFAQTPGGGKVVSGLIEGVGNNLSQQSAQQKAYDLQQQAILAQRARYNASLQGLTSPVYQPPKKG